MPTTLLRRHGEGLIQHDGSAVADGLGTGGGEEEPVLDFLQGEAPMKSAGRVAGEGRCGRAGRDLVHGKSFGVMTSPVVALALRNSALFLRAQTPVIRLDPSENSDEIGMIAERIESSLASDPLRIAETGLDGFLQRLKNCLDPFWRKLFLGEGESSVRGSVATAIANSTATLKSRSGSRGQSCFLASATSTASWARPCCRKSSPRLR